MQMDRSNFPRILEPQRLVSRCQKLIRIVNDNNASSLFCYFYVYVYLLIVNMSTKSKYDFITY